MSEKNIVDIDEFLKEKAVTIKINGKNFTVKDIDEETQKKMSKSEDEINYRDIVKSVLGCSDEDLQGYGIVAMATIIDEVTKNLFPSSSESVTSEG